MIIKLISLPIISTRALNQIKTKKNEYPYKVNKMPVKASLLDHFIMPALVEMSQSCFYKHYEIYYNPGEHMEAMETGYSKKISAKGNRPRGTHSMPIMHHTRNYRPPRIVRNGSGPFFYFAIYQNRVFQC